MPQKQNKRQIPDLRRPFNLKGETPNLSALKSSVKYQDCKSSIWINHRFHRLRRGRNSEGDLQGSEVLAREKHRSQRSQT